LKIPAGISEGAIFFKLVPRIPNSIKGTQIDYLPAVKLSLLLC
jgi:hypothetical protein